METTWLIAANRTRARILEVRALNETPREAAVFVNPVARTHERDLDSDAAGRFYGKGERQQGHAAAPSEDFSDRETERFVNDVRDHLERGRNEHRFERLWVIASPAVLGLLRRACPKPLQQRVEFEVAKDLTMERPEEIFRQALAARDARADQAKRKRG